MRIDDDDWTLRTIDGAHSTHFEHTLLITRNRPILAEFAAVTASVIPVNSMIPTWAVQLVLVGAFSGAYVTSRNASWQRG